MTSARFCIIPARALGDKRITRNDIMVLNALGMYGDKDGWSFPAIGTIAELINAHRVSVSKSISNLVACGYVESRPRRRDDGGQTSNEYRILFDQPSLFDGQKQEEPTPPIAQPLHPHSEAATPPIALDAMPPVAHTLHPMNEPNLTTQIKEEHPQNKNGKKYPEEFETLWNAWPKERRCEKPEAFKAWREAIRKIHPAELLAAVKLYTTSKDAKEGFAPYPAKWLKRERWLEFPLESQQATHDITLEALGGDTPDNRLFFALMQHLREKLGDAVWRSWITPLRFGAVKAGNLVIHAPSRFVAEWVKNHHGEEILKQAQHYWNPLTGLVIAQTAIGNLATPEKH